MAVYVKPNGLLGSVYMAAIRPFRHLIVYPPMLREMGRNWRAAAACAGRPTCGGTQCSSTLLRWNDHSGDFVSHASNPVFGG
jgi:Protein of unknown function (DUF2867)